MKYPQHIAAVTSDYVANHLNLREGFDAETPYEQFLQTAPEHLFLGQREAMEKNPAFRQLLPYTAFVHQIHSEDGRVPDRITLYRRAKTVGEEKLYGKFSIGFGGHIDQNDIAASEESAILLDRTIDYSSNRELHEELMMLDEIDDIPPASMPRWLGFINDNSDKVGQHHLGLARVICYSREYRALSHEPNQIIIGNFTVAELLNGDYDFENWSRLLLEYLTTQVNEHGQLFR